MIQATRTFSILAFTILMVSFYSCGTSKSTDSNFVLEKESPFEIAQVFSQKWIAGTKEGGSGTTIQINFKNIEEGVSIKNLFFRNNKIEAIQSNVKNQLKGSFLNTDSEDIIMDSDPVNEAKNTPPTPFPFKLAANEMVISYLQNGTLSYFKIINIEEKPVLSYPQGNPNNKY